MNKPIYNITPFTLLDYPDKTACILWFAGCNMRCIYCYNPEIVLGKGSIEIQTALEFIKKRKGLLDAVVLSGGESTKSKELLKLVYEIKKNKFLVKIDTNGTNPELIKKLIKEKMVDYIALDIKSLPKDYQHVTNSKLANKVFETLDVLITSKIQYEARTTYHSGIISKMHVYEIADLLYNRGYRKEYYVQNFVNEKPTLKIIKHKTITIKQEEIQYEKLKIVVRN